MNRMQASPPSHSEMNPSAAPTPEVNFKARRVTLPGYLKQTASLANFFGHATWLSLSYGLFSRMERTGSAEENSQNWVRRKFLGFEDALCRTGQFQTDLESVRPLADLSGTIVVANHPSLLDAFFLLSRIPRSRCIIRSGIMHNPCFSGAARACGYILNDSGHTFVKQSVKHLKNGDNLLIFPEGSRTYPGQKIHPFKQGFALAALKSGAPVQCVFIRMSESHLSKGRSLFSPAHLPIHLQMTLGPRLQPSAGESPASFTSRVEALYQDDAVVGLIP